MNLRPDVAGGDSGNLSDRFRIHIFKIKKYQLAIDGLEPVDQLVKPFQSHSILGFAAVINRIRCNIDVFETHEILQLRPSLPDDMGRGRIVRNAIDPRSHRTSRLITLETLPELEVNLLQQVPALVGIRLIRAHEPVERGAVGVCGVFIQLIMVHAQIVPGGRALLQEFGRRRNACRTSAGVVAHTLC